MAGGYFLVRSLLEKCRIFLKNGRFYDGYGRIGEIPHGRIWPDWGL